MKPLRTFFSLILAAMPPLAATGTCWHPLGEGPVSFDGTAREFRMPAIGGPSNEMTIAFRFKADADTSAFPGVVHANGCFAFGAGRGFAWYEATGANGRAYDGYAHPRLLDVERWYDVAFTFDQKGMAVYWGGRRVKHKAAQGLGPITSGTRLVRVGRDFKGVIEDFRILDAACHDWPAERARAAQYQPMPRFAGSRLAIYAAGPMDWVWPDDRSRAKPAISLAFETAGNERESRQVFAYPMDRNVDRLRVRLPKRLRTASGEEAEFGISFREIVYSPLCQASHFMYENSTFPDRLEKREVFGRGAEPCFSLWMDVRTPAGTKPGLYRGRVTFDGGPGVCRDVVVEVKVHGFDLPARNTVPTLVSIWERDVLTYANGDASRFLELLREYCDVLLEHRINPVFLHEPDLVKVPAAKALYPIVRIGADGRDETNWGPWDDLVAHCRAKGLSAIVAGPYYRSTNVWNEARQTDDAAWKAWWRHVKEKGWLEDVVAYPIDEWGEALLPQARQVGRMVHECAPGFKWIVTSGNGNTPAPDRLAGVDIWCPQLHCVDIAGKRRIQSAGAKSWFYVCTGPNFPTPNLHGDTPLAGIRMVPGAGIRFGFDGFLHWGANFNTGRGKRPVASYGFAEAQYVWADADGHPVPTCRLRALADGMEDWMAADMLKRLNPGAWEPLAERLEKLIPEKEVDPDVKVTWRSPDRASFRTFLPENAFYGVYGEPEAYLKWRSNLYDALSREHAGKKQDDQIQRKGRSQ